LFDNLRHRPLGLPVLVAATLVVICSPLGVGDPRATAASGYLTGVDVSHWNGSVAWRAARDGGVRFVIAKATEGLTINDQQYVRNKTKADRLGLAFTAYHFARPDGGAKDALREADHFVTIAALRGRHLLPALDLELTGGLSRSRLTDWVRAWLSRVESRLGVKPMIYTSPSFWQERMGDTRWFADNGYDVLWIAHWDVSAPRVPATNWSGFGWTFWQFTSCGRLPGFSGCVDVDRYNGTDLSRLTIRSRRATA
jgi:lysozyme